MRRYLIIGSILLVLILIGFGLYFLFGREDTVPTPPGGTDFPIVDPSQGGTIPVTKVNDQNGAGVVVRDFLTNGTTVEDPANKGTYYLAGETGYCYPDGTCVRGAPATDFNIVYFPEDDSFVIALLSEPLGAARVAAEQFMLETLGISEAQLCILNYYVSTDSYVNPQFAGKNLGFSFCEGATRLP